MAFYLLKEDGGRFTLEQGGGSILLEETGVPTTSVIYGGDDAPRKRKRQRTYHDLFKEIEQTIHALVDPPEFSDDVVDAVSPPTLRPDNLEQAINDLVQLAEGQHALLQQAASLRAELAHWEANRRRFLEEDEADWEWFL